MKVIVAFTGASGQIYGLKILEILREEGVETHVIVSKAALLTMKAEGIEFEDVKKKASTIYSNEDIGARLSSGTFKHDGMIVAPCSIKTASSIACGITDNLISRAADVTLKERRRLVLLVRETPLHTGHLRTLLALSEIGAIIMPPVPAFYTRPKSVDDIVTHTALRAISLLGIDCKCYEWKGIVDS